MPLVLSGFNYSYPLFITQSTERYHAIDQHDQKLKCHAKNASCIYSHGIKKIYL